MFFILNVNNIDVKMSKKYIIENMKFNILEKEIVAIIAPNGQGKTTLFKAISLLLNLNKGEVLVNGISGQKNEKRYLKSIFFIETTENLYKNLTVLDHLNYVKNTWKSNINVEEIINNLKMDEYKNKKIHKLSLGMKQNLLMGMYLASDADIFLLDEPFNGLDPLRVDNINKFLLLSSKNGKSILISSHDLSNIKRICSKVLFLKDKKIFYETSDLTNIDLTYRYLFEEEGIHNAKI